MFFVCFVGALTLGIIFAGSVALIYNSQTLDEGRLTSYTHTLQVLDKDGEAVTAQSTPLTVSVSELSEHTLWAFVCTEDKNFYKHKGLEYKRIAKAATNNAKAGKTKEGASTITQQLIKNTHLNHEKSMRRKVREAALARKLEKQFSKNEILEMYLNVIYFGNGVYGLENASKYYFDKPARELSLRESAALAGLLRSPARYDPINNKDNSEQRTNLVLGLMHEQGRISTDDYAAARAAKLETSEKVRQKGSVVGASYKNAAIAQAAKLLGVGCEEIAQLGYKIYTYYDPQVQAAVMDTVTAEDYKIVNVSGRTADCVVMSSDTHGRVNALYTNNATLPGARRNFASALKPLVVYAPALELGVITPATTVIDEPFVTSDFNPRNHDGVFRGAVSVRDSVAHSYNIPAVKTLEYARLSRAEDVARRLGLSLEGENLSLALGNTTKGVSYNELLAGYCTLANGGIRIAPSYISRIANRDGKTVWEHVQPAVRVLGEDTCFLMTDMLKDAARVGTARKLSSLDCDIAAKTGTAERGGGVTGNNNTDAVCVSYTPHNVLVVWHGNADMKAANDLPSGVTGGGITSFIASDIQASLNKDSTAVFAMPDSIEKTGGEFYAKRFPALINMTGEIKLRPPLLGGKIGDSGAPTLWFAASASAVYEIYRTNSAAADTLLEVIKNFDGEYVYTDRHAIKGKVHEYYVTTDGEKSNAVKLFTASEINRGAVSVTKKPSGKHWFF